MDQSQSMTSLLVKQVNNKDLVAGDKTDVQLESIIYMVTTSHTTHLSASARKLCIILEEM